MCTLAQQCCFHMVLQTWQLCHANWHNAPFRSIRVMTVNMHTLVRQLIAEHASCLCPVTDCASVWTVRQKSPVPISCLSEPNSTTCICCLQVLSTGGIDYKVDAAYIWNVGSWDVQGIHTASAKWNTTVIQGDWPVQNGYADAGVIAAIRTHNAKAA